MAGVVNLDTRRRRTYAGEQAWFALLEELGHRGLRRGLIGCGVSAQVSANLVFFIEDQMLLDRVYVQTGETRSRYRKVLADLDPEEVRARAIPGLFNLAWSA